MPRINKAIPKWDENKKRWTYRIYLHGKQCAFYSSLAGKKGAAECKRKADLARANNARTEKIRIIDLHEHYLNYTETRHPLGKNSSAWRHGDLYGRVHILPKLKNRYINDITGMDWQDLIDTAKPTKRKYKNKTVTIERTTNGHLSAKTLGHLRSVIIALCNHAILLEHDVRVPKLTIPYAREKIEKNILNTNHALELLNLPYDKDIYINAFKLAVVAGMRPGEVLGLQESDFDGDFFYIKRSINYKDIITTGKNENSNRFEYMHDLIKTIINDQRKLKIKLGILSPWFFPWVDGSQPKQTQLRGNLARLCNRQGWAHVTPYRLRHTLVSVMAGRVDLGKIKDVLGHSASMDTLGTYSTLLKDNAKIAGTTLGDAWQEIKTSIKQVY